jgi:hypothetical protein
VPKLLYARPPGDPDEARQVRKLANSRHAPGDWILRARMIVRSWIIWLVAPDPPGRLVRGAGGELEARDEEKEAHWTLDALTASAREHGITVGLGRARAR